MSLSTQFIALNDGTEICAPDSVNLMTNFVLREQGDWFEDEMNFVRAYIQPGMNALDIGANYGLYATAIAKQLEAEGRLWCFEPTPDTAAALQQTLEKNHYADRVHVIKAGLSDRVGQASFFTSPNAELNSLSADAMDGAEEQTIELLTLDHCMSEYQWPAIDFVKLDAEGEELKILAAGAEFFKQNAPLVMFELKHLENVNLPLLDAFQALGYQPYYLIPGLNVLAPFKPEEHHDAFLLNVFGAKDETMAALIEQGFAVTNEENESPQSSLDPLAQLAEIKAFDSAIIKRLAATDLGSEYGQAWLAYMSSRDVTLSTQLRYQNLMHSMSFVKQALGQGESKPERLCTYARVAFELGMRQVGLQILHYIIKRYMQQAHSFGVSEFFVPPGKEFEAIEPVNSLEAWLCAAVLEQQVRKGTFSCYFNGDQSLPIFNNLRSLNLLSPDMERREQLVLERQAANAN